MKSEELDQLATALAAAQAEFTAVPKDSENPFFKSKYASLATVTKTASPILTKHGLSVAQFMGYDGEHDTLETWLLHKSGQFISREMRLHLVKDDPQGHGSASTYARRYGYMAALGLVADDDDDGNAASRSSARRNTQSQYASPEQQKLIFARAKADNVGPQQLANAIRRAANRDELEDEREQTAREQVDFMLKHLPPRLVNPVLEQIARIAEDVPDVVPQ